MKGILALFMASLMVLAIAVPVVVGDSATTSANIGDVASTYDCSGTSITTQPDPANGNAGTVNYDLVVTDDNGGDTIPDDTWTAEVDFGSGTQTDSLTAGAASGLQRTCTGTGSVPANTAAGDYTVTFKFDGTQVCTTTVTVASVAAYAIDFNAVNYGAIVPGASATVNGDGTMETVGAAPSVKPTIENKGNVAMDVQMSIADAGTNPETLFEGNTGATIGSVSQTLGSTAASFDVNIASGATAAIDTTLSVPTGIQSGSYSGTLTVTGVTG